MKNVIGLLLLGAILGGAWLWFSDREKAEDIADSITTKAEQVGAATTQAVENARPKLEQAKAAATQAANKIHVAATQAIETIEPYLEKIKSATTQAAEKVRQHVSPAELGKDK